MFFDNFNMMIIKIKKILKNIVTCYYYYYYLSLSHFFEKNNKTNFPE